MFHANAWGLAHAAVATGAASRDAGPRPVRAGDRRSHRRREGHRRGRRSDDLDGRCCRSSKGKDTSLLRAIPCGGSAVPKALSEAYREQLGLPILQAWGMTETSPIAAVCRLDADEATPARRTSRPSCAPRSGRIMFGAECGSSSPTRGPGALGWREQRRAAVSRQLDRRRLLRRRTFAARASPTTAGCGPATSPPSTQRARIRLVDRTKDLIKSGGEWISSVELENELMAHPKIAEAAVIGVAHERWGERPLACVVQGRAPN